MTSVIADTGFWIAFLSANDAHHARARELHELGDFYYITTWPVLTEACHLLATRVQPEAALELIEVGEGGSFEVARLPENSMERSAKLMRRYIDLPMDLADASLVILAEELGHGRILSTDQRDFKTYRWKNHKPFQNLMLPG